MGDDQIEIEEYDDLPYDGLDAINFGIITMGMKGLPFYKDDLYLGMQAMNIGIVDSVITQFEYTMLREWFEIEQTPTDTALAVSAMSQMWIYGLYEVFRMWRDRRYQFDKLLKNGGIELKVSNMCDNDPANMTVDIRKRQLLRFKNEVEYREDINNTWDKIEPVYRMIELFRLNLAKHCAPGKDNVMPHAPGYGRINQWCGSMDYELVDSNGQYITMNRRDIADTLRVCIKEIKSPS